MATSEFVGLVAGAVGLGIVHGVEPGHGWPVAASYALERTNKWVAGFLASFILGFGHLVSSIAMVLVFFWAKAYFDLTQIGWMNYVAGGLLILLGLREARMFYRGEGHHHHHGGDDGGHEHGHSHEDGGHSHDHDDDDHGHSHDGHDHDHADRAHDHGDDDPLTLPGQESPDHAHADHSHSHDDSHGHDHGHGDSGGVLARLWAALPFGGGGGHTHLAPGEATDRGIWGITAFAFALGFAHEEEFEIIALCAGSNFCLELMTVYALAVIAAIVSFTLLLIAGYEHYEDRVEQYAPYLPAFSAVVLILMGLGFLLGVF